MQTRGLQSALFHKYELPSDKYRSSFDPSAYTLRFSVPLSEEWNVRPLHNGLPGVLTPTFLLGDRKLPFSQLTCTDPLKHETGAHKKLRIQYNTALRITTAMNESEASAHLLISFSGPP